MPAQGGYIAAAELPRSMARDAAPAQMDTAAYEPVARDTGAGVCLGGSQGAPQELDASEKEIIEKCLAHGLDDEAIYGILEEHRLRQSQMQEAEALGSTQQPLEEHMTPPETPGEGGPASVAGKRAKAREISTVTIGDFDSDKSRSAFLQSQQQAAAARSRNRASQGIFG